MDAVHRFEGTVNRVQGERSRSNAGVGHALMSQLLTNLDALRVECVRTEVDWHYFQLNRFLADCGFVPAQRMALSLTVPPESAP